jgi:hypothetical protein
MTSPHGICGKAKGHANSYRKHFSLMFICCSDLRAGSLRGRE